MEFINSENQIIYGTWYKRELYTRVKCHTHHYANSDEVILCSLHQVDIWLVLCTQNVVHHTVQISMLYDLTHFALNNASECTVIYVFVLFHG